VALCKMFHGARLIWEIPGPGLTFGVTVQELHYGNIYFRPADPSNPFSRPSERPGWFSNRDTKRALLEEYRGSLTNGKFLNPSERALRECLNFENRPDGSVEHGMEESTADPAAARVNHGDMAMADALAYLGGKGMIAEKQKPVVDEYPMGSMKWRRFNATYVKEDSWA
jgi:hypothetical protein